MCVPAFQPFPRVLHFQDRRSQLLQGFLGLSPVDCAILGSSLSQETSPPPSLQVVPLLSLASLHFLSPPSSGRPLWPPSASQG